jgi:hypothetical protein
MVDGHSCLVVAVWPQVPVGVQGFHCRLMAETALDRFYGATLGDKKGRVKVAQVMKSCPRRQPGRFACAVPHLVHGAAPQWFAHRIGEYHPSGTRTVTGKVGGQDCAYDLGHRHCAKAGDGLGRAKLGHTATDGNELGSTRTLRRKKSTRSIVRPKHSPWRSPMPAAKTISAR